MVGNLLGADDPKPPPSVVAGVSAALVVLAATARFYQIDSQLWLDEMSALNSIRRPAWDILTKWPGTTSHVLYELLARAGLATLGETPLAIRLPAAVFGVAGVWLLIRLARDLMPSGAALFVGGLFALSYHHVLFSQNARGYTALVCFYLLASLLLFRIRNQERAGLGLWALYTLAVVLAGYSNLLGLFVLAGHAAVVSGAALMARWRQAPRWESLSRYYASALAAVVVLGLLYAPFVRGVFAYTQSNVAEAGEGPRLGLWLVAEVFEGLAAAFGGPAGLAVAAGLGLVGLIWWIRHRAFALAVLAGPLLVQGTVFVVLGAGIHPRYFSVALPVVYLIGGYGTYAVIAAAARWLPLPPVRRATAVGATLVLVVAVSTVPLARYYRYPKQDFLGAAAALDSLSAAGDATAGVHLAGRVLRGYYHYPYLQVETLADLDRLERSHSRVWLVTTLERLLAVEDSALLAHLRTSYDVVRVFPGTIGDGTVRIYTSRKERQP